MQLNSVLEERCEGKCELCLASESRIAYTIPPKSDENPNHQIVVCELCFSQIDNPDTIDKNHMRCLSESMWSQVPAVQVMSYRMLERLSDEGWAQDALNMIYMDETTLEWAKEGNETEKIIHKDSNGHVLQAGDSVVLIKDLKVKGANFTAKRGTAVRRIRLVHDNPGQIEGKVEGQQIVILTEYVNKSN